MEIETPIDHPKESATSTCYHCGEPITNELITFDTHSFCCQGCSMVYEILQENDLCRYYSIEGAQGVSPDANFYKEKFDYLDLPEVSTKVLEFTDGQQGIVNWYIPKMHCSSCIWLLEQLHRLNPAVRNSVVNFPEKKARITFDLDKITLSELARLLTSIGYEPYLSLDDLNGTKPSRWNRSRLYKIGISGFAFGNIMMMSFPEYFHLGSDGGDQDLKFMFNIINVILSIPVFFYCASDFFVSAYGALKARYLNIDAPIALALISVYANSLYQVGTATGPGYFDSLAGAIFFMLLGRHFQDKTYAGISFDRDFKSYFPIAITLIRDGQEVKVPIATLKEGDVMRIRNEELIPADAILVSASARINYSFVSGEAKPVSRRKGETIYAGGKQMGTAIELEVLRPVSQGYLTQLWNNDSFSRTKEDQQQTLSARINKYFSTIVLALAAVTFLIWFFIGKDSVTAFNAFTTLLLVACPCALLLSSTFTNGNLLALFGKHKFYPKNAHALERLASIDSIVFDKTGTITLPNETDVAYEGIPLKAGELIAIKSVAMQSAHPLSRILVKHLSSTPASKRELKDFEELSGAGIRAHFGNDQVKIGSAHWLNLPSEPNVHNRSVVYIGIKGALLGRFIFRSKYRPELAATLSKLKNKGFETFLVSGDKSSDKEFLTNIFGQEKHLAFEQKPDDKLRYIANLQARNKKVMMIGDGLNDAGALSQSDVGLAVSDDINNFSPSCDAIIEGSMLEQLPGFIGLAQSGQKIIKISFAISLIYNAIGISFAITGQLTPVLAAILMPISSITVVTFTTIATSYAARRWINTDKRQFLSSEGSY
ncbi:heavy metal translocating P-type ATPase [Dyadobacter tibetensis]|uniref:heavy metal translocating P-type ATPase n=1 Tax=Dyadobacter tibetensis TaxID=1211851 RepID=UPI0004724366|nr:heavy metal translocating P-type ATPase metal-binding domain-containing protein [Dyadobacter tibetensis]